jgi:hypothetical protein
MAVVAPVCSIMALRFFAHTEASILTALVVPPGAVVVRQDASLTFAVTASHAEFPFFLVFHFGHGSISLRFFMV